MSYSPLPSDLTTLAQVKEYMTISDDDTSQDDLLQMLLSAASVAIANYCQRTFQLQQYNEVRDGTGQPTIVTLGYPVQSVSAVSICGRPIPAAVGWPRSGYSNGAWYIRIDGFEVPFGGKVLALSYMAGYSTIPPDLAMAACETTLLAYKQKDWVGEDGSQGIDGQHVSYKDIAITAATMMRLQPYKRVTQIPQ